MVFSTIVFVIVFTFFITVKTNNNSLENNNNKLSNLLTFSNDDVEEVWILEGNKVLSYHYKIEPKIAVQISNYLVMSNKEDKKESLVAPYSQIFAVNVFLKNHNNNDTKRLLNIIPKDDSSVFVIMKTQTKSGTLVDSCTLWVESSELAQYIDNIRKSFQL